MFSEWHCGRKGKKTGLVIRRIGFESSKEMYMMFLEKLNEDFDDDLFSDAL